MASCIRRLLLLTLIMETLFDREGVLCKLVLLIIILILVIYKKDEREKVCNL